MIKVWRDIRGNVTVADVDGVEFVLPDELLRALDRRALYDLPPHTPYRADEPMFWYAYSSVQILKGEISGQEHGRNLRLLAVAKFAEDLRAQRL